MPYTYDHIEETIMDATQRGAFNSFIQSTWTGNNNDVISATVRRQAGGGVTVVEVTGTKLINTEVQLPDPPFEVVDRTGSNYTVQFTERGALNTGGQNNLDNFIGTVWPGAVGDVTELDFLRVLDETQTWQMRSTLRGTLSAATQDDLPSGRRFRVKTKT